LSEGGQRAVAWSLSITADAYEATMATMPQST
jgi:hypothetical protein